MVAKGTKKAQKVPDLSMASEDFDSVMRGAFVAPKPYPKKAKGSKRGKKAAKK